MEPTNTQNPHSASNGAGAQGKASTVILSPADRVLDRLDRVKATGPGAWLASCPTGAHRYGDRSRGLSVREGDDGRVLIHCFAGCGVAEVIGAIGLELADLFPAKPTDYPGRAPRGGITGRDRHRRIPWTTLFEGISHDLQVCSLAFSDLANGKTFNPKDSEAISRLAGHLASEIREAISAGY